MDKEKLGLYLQLGSLLLPGAGEVAGASLGTKALTPILGKTMGKAVSQGIGAGGLSGLVEGVGRGLKEDKNPLLTGVQDSILGALGMGLVGYGAGNITRANFGNKLRKMPDKRRWQKHDLRQTGKKFFGEYIQQRTANTEKGPMYFNSTGVREDWKHNPKVMKGYPTLIRDIEKSKYIGPEDPVHQHDNITLFHKFSDGKNSFYGAELDGGKLIYYKTLNNQKAPEGLPVKTDATSANNIINDLQTNFNPSSLFEKIMTNFRK